MIIDCDANATYAPDEDIQEFILAHWGALGNPSSLHRGGQRARALLEEARASVRGLLKTGQGAQVIFTSGATEANNTCIAAGAERPGRLVSSLVEHPCVLEPLRALQSRGREVVLVAPDSDGVVAPDAVEAVVNAETAFVSVMAANNEVGVINDVAEISARIRRRAPGALIHTDAAQLLGKGELSFDSMGVDLLTLSGHKLGALSGVGAIVAREGLHVSPYVRGGPQEGKVRGGTENVLGIATLGAVAEALRWDLPTRMESMRRIRDEFERAVVTSVSGCVINGPQRERLPNTSSVFIPGVRADDLVVAMDLEGVLISSGAACSSGKPEPSHVLLAMGQEEERVRSTVRVSFRADQPAGTGERVVEVLSRAVARMRSVGGSLGRGA